MHDFSFDGVSLSSFAGRILQAPVHTVASRNITRVKIYGQSGDEIIDNGSYDNVDFSLKIGFLPHLTQYTAQQLARAVIDWLAPRQDGYYVYRDTLNAGYFTRACLTNFAEIKRELRTYLTATLKFTRVPFWYSDVGAQPVAANNGAVTLTNPEIYSAEPIYHFEYTGTAGNNIWMNVWNGSTFVGRFYVSSTWKTHYIDSVEKQHYTFVDNQRYYPDTLLFPNLPPNAQTRITSQLVNYGAGVNYTLEITPNWRRL